MNTTTSPFEITREVLFAAAVLCAVAGSSFLPDGCVSVALAMAAIALAVWHGAFDQALARESLEPYLRKRWPWVFYPAYLLLAGICMLLWWALPVVALPLFLLYSALHFGTEDEQSRSPLTLLTGCARGWVPIAAACRWSPQEVQAIFAQMMRGDMGWSQELTRAAGLSLLPCVGLAAGGFLLIHRKHQLIGLSTIAAELCLFRWCSPLVGFAVFFCLRHTPDHLVSTSLDRDGCFQLNKMWSHLKEGLWPWLVALLAMAMAARLGAASVKAYTGVLFIGLSALTVPHMVFAEVCRWLESPRQPRFALAGEWTR